VDPEMTLLTGDLSIPRSKEMIKSAPGGFNGQKRL